MTYDKPTLMENELKLISVESEAYQNFGAAKNRTIMTKNPPLAVCPHNGICLLNSVPGWLNTLYHT